MVLVYIVLGILLNKFFMHKEGSDVVPQKTLWVKFPSLVKVSYLSFLLSYFTSFRKLKQIFPHFILFIVYSLSRTIWLLQIPDSQ